MGTERSHGAHRSTEQYQALRLGLGRSITAKASRWGWMDVRVECRNMQWALRYMYALGRVGSGRGHGMERAGLIALLRTTGRFGALSTVPDPCASVAPMPNRTVSECAH